MSTVANYIGRTVDMLAFRSVSTTRNGKEQLLAQELIQPGDGGMLISGIQKLAQKVLLILLTKMGSRTYAPTEGTTFMIDAGRGDWRTPADVSESFYAARLDVSRQCRATELSTDPDDEKWGSFDLDGVTLSADLVSIRVTLVSAAGTSYTLLTPISVPIK